MSQEDAKAYLEFLEHGSTAGLTDAELLGIQKVDDALALNKLDYGSPVILQNPQIKGTNSGLNYNLQFFAKKSLHYLCEKAIEQNKDILHSGI